MHEQFDFVRVPRRLFTYVRTNPWWIEVGTARQYRRVRWNGEFVAQTSHEPSNSNNWRQNRANRGGSPDHARGLQPRARPSNPRNAPNNEKEWYCYDLRGSIKIISDFIDTVDPYLDGVRSVRSPLSYLQYARLCADSIVRGRKRATLILTYIYFYNISKTFSSKRSYEVERCKADLRGHQIKTLLSGEEKEQGVPDLRSDKAGRTAMPVVKLSWNRVPWIHLRRHLRKRTWQKEDKVENNARSCRTIGRSL